MPDLPFISVVIPTRGRPRALAACLGALAAQDYPRERFEVLVVEDGPGAPPTQVAQTLEPKIEIRILQQARSGPAAARNLAAQHARGVLLAFTDDDCLPAPEWLGRVAAASRAAPGCAIGGRTITAFPDNVYSAASQTVVDFVYAYYNRVPEQAHFFASNNLAVPAEAFRELGGFDERFTTAEDREFCDRWRRAGHRLVYEPRAVVVHANGLGLAGFAMQHFGYGRGAFAFHRARSGPVAASVARESTFYLELPALARRAVTARKNDRALFASTLVIWQVANAAGFAWEATRHLTGRGAPHGSAGVPPARVAAANSAKVAAS